MRNILEKCLNRLLRLVSCIWNLDTADAPLHRTLLQAGHKPSCQIGNVEDKTI